MFKRDLLISNLNNLDNPSYGVTRITSIQKRIAEEDTIGTLFLLKDQEKVITQPHPKRGDQVGEYQYLAYDYRWTVIEFCMFFRNWSDQNVILALNDGRLLLVRLDDRYYGTYTMDQVHHELNVGNEILFLKGYVERIQGELREYVILIDRNQDRVSTLR